MADKNPLQVAKDMNNYLGIHMEPLRMKKERKKNFTHPIFLYDPEEDNVKFEDGKFFDRLTQIVNIYEHTIEDFEFNAKRIIKHFKKYYGDTDTGVFTLGQSIRFRVYKGQEPIDLSMFAFLMNYTMLIVPILMGADMKEWKPWTPERWTSKGWCAQMNIYIQKVRHLGSPRRICELIEYSKWLMNLWCAEAGDRLGLSISNNDFIEVCNRSKEAYDLINCNYEIPDDMEPSEIEHLKKSYTARLLDIMSEQTDLPISIYAKNGLFNPGQASEFFVMLGFKPDLYDHTIQMTHPTNIIKGLKHPVAFMVDAYGGRKAEVLKLNVSDAGAFERSLTMLLSTIRKVDPDYECDSRHFRVRDITGIDMLDRLDGRVATLDPKSDEYFIIDPRNTNLIGKRLYIKTPITCTHPDRENGTICSACYGKLMSQLNCDVHIGKLAGLNLADDMEQKLLSAKHALATNTNDIEFDDLFNAYFTKAAGHIRFNSAMIDESQNNSADFNQLYLEFHLNGMTKSQDGEGRHYDRATPEIVIYNKKDDTRVVISEKNGIPIYLHPEFATDWFKEAATYTKPDEPIMIPFSSLIDNGKVLCETLFEYQYQNNGIAKPLNTIQETLSKMSRINAFADYDECLNFLIPLFIAGGIHLPEFQQELLVSQLIYSMDGKPVDWTLEKPEYQFYTIDKAIYANPSPITSILYHESSMQLAGAYGTYNKKGTSEYDWFLYDGQ